MKKIFIMILAAILIVPAFSQGAILAPARVQLVDGDVMFRSPDAEEWLPVSVNTPLDEGDAIWVPDGGKTEIQLADGTAVRLDGGSQLDFMAVEDGFTHLHLANGRLYLRTARNAGKNSLQIDADDTTIVPDARTRLRVDMLPDSQEDVAIFKGSAYVEGNGNRTKVRAGEHIALEEGHNELLPLNPPDNWEKWNSERDRNQSRSTTAESYLPDELQQFSGELDSHGKWVQVPEYGMVWRPTFVVPAEWAPYRNGRWIWKENDFVWISYEYWGWAPYHYGRWAVVDNVGWCWVPPAKGDIYWGPGYVGWYRSGSHVGWTPLAPNEIFYGRKHYGRYSVNIANAPTMNTAISYKNRNVRDGFNLLLQNDFLRGRAIFQKPANAATVAVSVSLGSPRIKPVRETRMPIITPLPPRISPPPGLLRDSRDLRPRFPRVTPNSEKQQHAPPGITAPAENRTGTPSGSLGNNELRPQATPIPRPFSNNQQRNSGRQPLTVHEDKPPTRATLSRKGEAPGEGVKPREQKQKRVWKVTTTEQGTEKEQKEKDGQEHRGRK